MVKREKSKLETMMQQNQKMEALGTLASGIAHDFNNILGSIMGYAEIAQERDAQGVSSGEALGQIMRAADRAQSLVKRILSFSRKDVGAQRDQDLNASIQQILQMISPTLPKMITIETDLAADLKLVKVDSNQMEQVLLNLATNAADAMPEGGCLSLKTENVHLDENHCRRRPDVSPGPHVRLVVSDTGQGIDPQNLEHVFEPFFTTKEVGKGTGLGLFMTYGIVKNHGGYMTCRSEPGRGTTFELYLPAGLAPENAQPPKAEPLTELEGDGERILLVDDEEGLLETGSLIMTGMGYRVDTARNGEEALEMCIAKGDDLDLVVTDLGMPGIGGHRFVKELMAIRPQAKVVIASGYAPNEQVEELLASGGSAFLAKPFGRAELLATVRSALDRP